MIELHNLTLGYNRHPAVHHLSLTFKKGSMTAIVGANGAGKSTLLKGLAGELTPLSGQINKSGSLIYVPQNPVFNFDLPITLHDFMMFADSTNEALTKALSVMRLTDFIKTPMSKLSGGQLQRAIFARLLASKDEIILLDEPFSAMDQAIIEEAMTALKALGKTVIAVLHDEGLVRRHFSQTLILARHMVAFGETSHVMTEENLIKMQDLRESFDEKAEHCHES